MTAAPLSATRSASDMPMRTPLSSVQRDPSLPIATRDSPRSACSSWK
jgi:hypothetical protein